MANGADPPAPPRILAPFEAGIRQAHVHRSYLAARLAAEERYAADLQRVLDAHPPPLDEPDSASERPHRLRSKARSPTTAALDGHARDAWLAYRHADQSEADARLRRVQLVRQEALDPLDDWCRGQERALENLRRNLQASYRAYDEARTKHLPAARNAYGKKCSELDELTHQEETVALQRQQLARSSPLLATDEASLSTTLAGPDDVSKSSPTDVYSPTGDQHRSLPKFIDAVRNKEIREGWDVAREAAKKTSIFSRRGRDTPEYTYDPAGMEALLRKKARAEREVEELDAKYRDMVIKLETLRLSLQHFLVVAQDQCRSHRSELGAELLRVWTLDHEKAKFVSDELTVFRSEAEHNAAPHCSKIQDDVELVEEQLQQLEGNWVLPSVPYVNHRSNEASDLLFGVRLMDYASSRNSHSEPPLIVQKCVAYLDTHALDTEGLYRISGKRTAVQALAYRAEKNERSFTLSPDKDDPAAVAGLLKRYLRELPDPVLPLSWEAMAQYTRTRVDETRTGWPFLRKKIRNQPPIHQATLQLLLGHLGRVAGNSQKNRMTASNLALVLGPVIFFGATAMEDSNQLVGMERDRTMEDLIVFGGPIFEDLTCSTSPFSSFPNPGPSPSLASIKIIPPASDPAPAADHPVHAEQTVRLPTYSSEARAPWVQKASLASDLVRRVSEGPVMRSKRIQGRHHHNPSSPLPGERPPAASTTSLPGTVNTGLAGALGPLQVEVGSATPPASMNPPPGYEETLQSPTTRPPPALAAGIGPAPRLPQRPTPAPKEPPALPSRPASLVSPGCASGGGPPPPPVPVRPSSIHGEQGEPRRTSWEGTYLSAQSLLHPRRSISSGTGGPPPPPLPTVPQAAQAPRDLAPAPLSPQAAGPDEVSHPAGSCLTSQSSERLDHAPGPADTAH